MRPLQWSDSTHILEWRNHESVRAHSRNTAIISESEHENWVRAKIELADVSNQVWIFSENQTPVGMTRLDQLDKSNPELSILVDPNLLSQGYGTVMLKKTLELETYGSHVSAILAVIHNSNLPSIALFTKFGFVKSNGSGEFSTFLLSKK